MKLQLCFCLGIGLLALAGTGCCSHPSHPAWISHPSAGGVPSSPSIPAPAGSPEILTPSPSTGNGVPPLNTPSSSRFLPPNMPPDLLPPTNVPLDARYYGPGALKFQTVEPPVAPLNPFSSPAAKPDASKENPVPSELQDPNRPERIPPPAVVESPIEKTGISFPDGISGFAEVKDRVSAGLRPEPEGLEWLKNHGYKTVLHIRRPGVDDSADQELVAKKGMKYLSLEVSPETLTGKLAAEFNAIIADRENRPLFVYDKEGTLAGAMWYLYFRISESMLPESARVRASQLGLKTTATELWIAIQKIPVP